MMAAMKRTCSNLSCFLCLLVGAALATMGSGHAEERNGMEHKIQPGEEIFYKQISGSLESKVLIEGRVAVDADGEVDLPNIGRISVRGKTIREIRKDYVSKVDQPDKGLYYHLALVPEVESDARIVEVSGGVAFPLALRWSQGMRLSDAIELCGGMPNAAAGKIYVARRSVMTVENIKQPYSKGPELEAGDKVYVPVILW